MGEVYVAEDLQLRRRVALKVPTAKDGDFDTRRFLQEARAASQLTHPNIARIYDFGTAPDGRPFLVMELVHGVSLKELLRRGPLTVDRAAATVAGVLRALSDAHAHSLVHRDIKPGNVMLTESDEVKVLDFGLAKEMIPVPSPGDETATTIADATAIGIVMGTPGYMSPEQVRGVAVDARTDLFSTGALLYECLTGVSPFAGSNSRDALDQVLIKDPVPPTARVPELDREWDVVLAKALRKDPEERYQSATEMLDAIERAARSRSRFWPGKRKPAILLAGAIVALAVAFAIRNGNPHQPSREASEWYRRGTEALRDGTYYAAERMLQKAVDLDPDFPLAHARLAEAANELDDTSRAATEMLAALPKGTGRMPGGVAGLYIDAIRSTLTRDFKQALNDYDQLSTQVQGMDKASVLVDTGRIYEKESDAGNALAAYRSAVALDPENAAAHLRSGILLGRKKDKDYGGELDRAFQIYQTLSNTEGQAEVLYERGLLLSSVDLTSARSVLERARDMARAIPSEQQEIGALLQLSTVAYLSGDLETAEHTAADGVERARRAGMNYLAARGLVDLGNTQFLKRDYVRAGNNYRDALDLSRRFAMRRTEARALFSLANLHQTLGNEQAAVEELPPALAYYREAGFQVEAVQCLLILARANRNLGHVSAASDDFDQALNTAKQLSDLPRVLLAEQGLASVSDSFGRLPQAIKEFELVRATAAALGDSDTLARTFTSLASVLGRLGKFQDSMHAIEQAEAAASKAPAQKSLEASILYDKAELAMNRGNHPEATMLFRKVYESEAADPQTAQSARCMAGLALARSGNASAGRQLCEPVLRELLATSDSIDAAEARISFGEILADAGASAGAIDTIKSVIDWAESAQDHELEWRALAIRAGVLRHRDKDAAKLAAGNAAKLLADLGWDAEDIHTYEARPDIQALKRTIQEGVR